MKVKDCPHCKGKKSFFVVTSTGRTYCFECGRRGEAPERIWVCWSPKDEHMLEGNMWENEQILDDPETHQVSYIRHDLADKGKPNG